MKKLLIALSVLAALFIATPSMALVGMPDNAPGYDVIQPFFLVGIPGQSTQDTLVVIQEVGGTTFRVPLYIDPNGAITIPHGAAKGRLHATIYDRFSVPRANWTVTYTPDDVIPYSVRLLINEYLPDPGDVDLAALEVDLDGDGVNDHYFGYIYFENRIVVTSALGLSLEWPLNNLIGKTYLVDLVEGIAAGANIPAREYVGLPFTADFSTTNYAWNQWYGLWDEAAIRDSATLLESFSANANATSALREHGQLFSATGYNATYFNLTPRFFLRTAASDTYFFLWTDFNNGYQPMDPTAPPAQWHYRKHFTIYDENEYGISITVDIPYELNWVDVARELPGGLEWDPPVGGWFDMPLNGTNNVHGYHVSDWRGNWLMYSYQTSVSTGADLNWGALFEVSRDVGTL